jgi:hypothetical protein
MSHHQNADQNLDIEIANRSFENVSQLIHLRKTVAYQILIQEEIMRTLNSGNACYLSAHNFLSSHLRTKKGIPISIHKTIIFHVVLYSCETWPLTFRKEHRMRVFENRVLRKLFRPNGDEVMQGWRKLHNKELHDL